jgi:hypothetical protein
MQGLLGIIGQKMNFIEQFVQRDQHRLYVREYAEANRRSYSHAVSQNRMAAAGDINCDSQPRIAILSHAADQSGLGAD